MVRMEDVQVVVPGVGPILGPVSLRVGAQERWVLLGPNGSGKTTLLSVAGAWRHPSAGQAWIFGQRIGRVDVRLIRARIGHVGHTVTEKIRGALSVRDVVLTGRTSTLETWFQAFTPADLAEADARLAQVGCLEMAERPIGTCSQGERARVLLARALFGRRDLLLFDEPAAGLDLPGRESLVSAMGSVAADPDGAPFILATHHLEEIPPGITHAALLRAGRLVADGPIEEVLTDAHLTDTFGLPITVTRRGERWTAFAS
jgi:iron complex transport system ATP-binding protein